jgi:uncharacterized protein (TIGR02246 family)
MVETQDDTRDPADFVRAYFEAAAAHDAEAIARCFAEDGELVTPAALPLAEGDRRVSGREAITELYRQAFARHRTDSPRPGPFVVDGDRVAVEIEVPAEVGLLRVSDFFTVGPDGIELLTVYFGGRVEAT